MLPSKSLQPRKHGPSHTTGRHGPMQNEPRVSRSKKRVVAGVRAEAQLADLRELFEHVQRRNRKVAAAVVTIAEHAAKASDLGLTRALGVVVAFVAKEAR
jgi:hypothetical protein